MKFQGLVLKAIKVRPSTGDFNPRAFSFNQRNQDVCYVYFLPLFCTMLSFATHLRSVSQNFTGSGFLIPSMLRIGKITPTAPPAMFFLIP